MKKTNNDWLSWAIGMTGGVLLWELFKPKLAVTPAQAAAAAAVSKAKYPDLGSVSARIDAVGKAFKAGAMTADAARAEAKELADAAMSFSAEKGEEATAIYAQALALQDNIDTAVQAKKFAPMF